MMSKFLKRYPNLPNPKYHPKIFGHYLKMFMREEGLGLSPKSNFNIKV